MSKVSFYRGKLEDYGDLNPNIKEGAIYFAEEGVIMLDDEEYVRYNPSKEIVDKEIETTVGGIAEGTKVEDLKGKSFSELFDTILFPVKQPKVKTYNSINWPNISDKNVKLGNAIVVPGKISYNEGLWENGDGSESLYTGEETSITYKYILNGKEYNSTVNSTNTPTLSGVTVYDQLGSNTYTVTVGYAAGDIPKNSKGESIPALQQSAGAIDKTYRVNVLVPFYTSTKNQDSSKEGALIPDSYKATATVDITVPDGSNNYKQWFSIPGTIKNIQQENPISGKYEDITHTVDTEKGWKPFKEERTFDGIKVDYYKYVWNGAVRDAVKLKVTFNIGK